MGDALKKTQAGQTLEIPAEAYNAFIDAVRDVRGRRHDVSQDANEPFRQSGIVKVRNKSGADRDRFDVLMIDQLNDKAVLVAWCKEQFNDMHCLLFVIWPALFLVLPFE